MREMGLRLHLLGGFGLVVDGVSTPVPVQGQRLLALLAVRTCATRSGLAGTLWSESGEARAQSNLRNAVWRVGQVSRLVLRCDRQTVGLSRQVAVDLHECQRRCHALISGAPLELTADLVGLLDHDVLPSWDEPWTLLERERQRQMRLHALEVLSDRLRSDGRYPHAVAAALAAVSAEPLRESAQRILMKAHLAEGNLNEAIRQYENYKQLVDTELAVAPGARLTAILQDALSRHADAARRRPYPHVDARGR